MRLELICSNSSKRLITHQTATKHHVTILTSGESFYLLAYFGFIKTKLTTTRSKHMPEWQSTLTSRALTQREAHINTIIISLTDDDMREKSELTNQSRGTVTSDQSQAGRLRSRSSVDDNEMMQSAK